MSIAQPDVEFRSDPRAGASSLWQILIPVAIVAGVLALAIGSNLSAYGGNLTGFVQFGHHFAAATHPPPSALVGSPDGYDGQFFFVQAHDPLLLHNSTVNSLRAAGEGFRLQRVGYPALAFLFGGGQAGAIPLALLAINVIVLLAITAGFARYAQRRGWSTMWALAIALTPGMLLPTLRDLSDPLATGAVLTGLLLWRGGRRWPAALALTVAVLTREVMMVAVVAVAAEAAWRARRTPPSWRATAARVWPVVVIPSVAFVAWQLYVAARYGGLTGGAPLTVPLLNLVQELGWSLHNYPPATALWDFLYLILIVAASVAAFMSLRQRVTVTSAAACALAVAVLVPTMGDVWSDTRLSAPLFALLLVDGLQRRHRLPVAIATAAAAMTVLIPFAIPGAF